MARRTRKADAIALLKEWLRDDYDATRTTADITNWLNDIGVPCTMRRASDWMREAIYQLADEHFPVTNPVYKNGYTRQSQATADERQLSRSQWDKEIRTRLSNRKRIAESDAAQADSTALERIQARVIKNAFEMYEMISEGTSG